MRFAPSGSYKFLSRTTAKEDEVTSRTFSSLMDDMKSLCLVKECRELKEHYKVNYTSKILATEPEDRHPVIKEMIHKKDLPLQERKEETLGSYP